MNSVSENNFFKNEPVESESYDMNFLLKKFSKRDKTFKDAIEKSGAGYFCISKEGLYVDINDEWLRMYKYNTAEEIIGKHYKLSRTEDDFEELEEIIKKVLKGATINFGEVKRICKDGTEGYHTLALSPVYIEGNIEGVEGYIIDTTKIFIAERELIKKLYKTVNYKKPIK
jgi:PAS domain S-box-containing protein